MLKFTGFITTIVLIGTLTACNPQNAEPTNTPEPRRTITASPSDVVLPDTQVPTQTQLPPQILNICLGSEPESLFYYGDSSAASRSVLQAIYDGPIDIHSDRFSPKIVEEIPSMENGRLKVVSSSVDRGEFIVDSSGNVAVLDEGISYSPTGCSDPSCAVEYAGTEPVEMDSIVVEFRIIDGIQWSDGEPLKASDSVFGFEIARELFRNSSWSAVQMAASYNAIDESTIQWTGLPGFKTPEYPTYFFLPLPEHLIDQVQPEEMLASDLTTRFPIGWGPFQIDEWIPGDHITLSKNPNYFRSGEGLPFYDFVVFRFVDSLGTALDAYQIGECDLLDSSVKLENSLEALTELDGSDNTVVIFHPSRSWEQISFGIDSLDVNQLPIFEPVQVRQAIANCVDRESIAGVANPLKPTIQTSYVSTDHPLFNPDVSEYSYDPGRADELFRLVGWIDHDLDPATPRISTKVPGIPDGTEFVISYLVPDDEIRIMVAGMIQNTFQDCGIQVEVITQPWNEVLAPGPDGPVFGRKFELAQFAWTSSFEPACWLYESTQIPGPYPVHPFSWGGTNAVGYSNPEFDAICQLAMASLRDSEAYRMNHLNAQMVFSEELPALPLYANHRVSAHNAEVCISNSNYDYFGVLIDIEELYSDSLCQ